MATYQPVQLRMGGAAPQQPGAYTPSFGSGSLQDLYTGFNNAYSAAYNANRQRSAQLRGLYQDRLNTARALINTGNAQEMSDIRSNWDAQMAGGMNQLSSLGLYSSNINPTMKAGYERQAQNDLARARERQARMALDYESRFEKMGRGQGGMGGAGGSYGGGSYNPVSSGSRYGGGSVGGSLWTYTDAQGNRRYTRSAQEAAREQYTGKNFLSGGGLRKSTTSGKNYVNSGDASRYTPSTKTSKPSGSYSGGASSKSPSFSSFLSSATSKFSNWGGLF